jgi:hypothetical protein
MTICGLTTRADHRIVGGKTGPRRVSQTFRGPVVPQSRKEGCPIMTQTRMTRRHALRFPPIIAAALALLTDSARGREGERLYEDRVNLACRPIDGHQTWVLEVGALEGAGLSEWDYAETAVLEAQHILGRQIVSRVLCSHMKRPRVWGDGRTHWHPREYALSRNEEPPDAA